MTNAEFTTTWRPRAELPQPRQQIVAVRLLPTLTIRRGVFLPIGGINEVALLYCYEQEAHYSWSKFDYWTPAAEFPPF